MQKRGTDPKLVRAATAEQLVTLSSVVALELVKGLSKVPFAQVQGWLSNKSFPQKAARKLAQELKAEVSQHDPRLVREQQFLASLGITVDITGLTISELPRGFNQIAINPVGQLTKEKLFEFCSKKFLSWKYYDDLDKATAKEQARPKTTYVFGYRGDTEPDKEHLGKSYDVAMAEGLTFLTVEERIWAELRYFANTGRYLDEVGGTITSSLTSDGDAFYARWNPDDRKFRVRGSHRSYANPVCGPREAVFA